jgi:uncharacterized phage-like protein YoqJ
MTIDQRLDRLTERHEALTRSVELLGHQQREWWQKHEQWWEKSQVRMAHLLETADNLSRIAHTHEQRISDLEDGRS